MMTWDWGNVDPTLDTDPKLGLQGLVKSSETTTNRPSVDSSSGLLYVVVLCLL